MSAPARVEGLGRRGRWRGRPAPALAACLIALGSCTLYRARPLEPIDSGGTGERESLAGVAVDASAIKHPLLAPVHVNVADGITPDEAALLAVAANPDLRAARAARGVAGAQLVAAGILPNPVLSGAVDVPTAPGTSAVTAVTLGAAVDLLGIATRSSERSAARLGVESVDLGLAWLEWQVAQAARLRAFDILLLDRALGLVTEQQRTLQAVVSTLRTAVAQQVATRVELGAAEVAYHAVVDAHLMLRMQRDTAALGLARTIGLDGSAPLEIQDVPIPFDGDSISPTALPTLDALMHDLGKRRLDLQGLGLGYASQEAKVRAAVLRQFPQISIGVNRIRDTGGLLTLGPAVTIAFPLFNRNQGEVAVAEATRAQMQAEYEARVFNARSTMRALLAELTASRRRLSNLRESVTAQQETVDLYRRALQARNADVLTYYTALSALMTSQLDVVATLRGVVELAVALETESGERFTPSNR
ncbi:MAG: TolC family protein [Gemmatimonadota bacterium]|nr:TolC family protein [Gemmatimonadota bacterium]